MKIQRRFVLLILFILAVPSLPSYSEETVGAPSVSQTEPVKSESVPETPSTQSVESAPSVVPPESTPSPTPSPTQSPTPTPTPTTPSSSAPAPVKKETRFVTFAGGMGVTQANWSSQGIGGSVNEYLDYDMDTTALTRLEGSMCIPKIGLTLGTNINMDNNSVAKSGRYMGYIGLKNFNMRVQSGKLSGTAEWTYPGQEQKVDFDEKISHVDLIYWFPRLLGIGGFLGVGYSKFAIPTEVKTYISQGSNDHYHAGVPFFDPNFKMKMYDLVFGFDTMTGQVMYGAKGLNPNKKDGFGVLFATEDRFGIGKNDISDEALAEGLSVQTDPGVQRIVGDNKTYMLVQNDTSLGVMWSKKTASTEIAIGLGYEVSFIFGDGFNMGNSTTEELLTQPTNSLLRHGPTARFFARF